MTRTRQPRLPAYLAVGAVALLAGVALGRPLLVAVGAPFVLFVLAGTLADNPPKLTASIDVQPQRVVEGESAAVALLLRSERAQIARVDLRFAPELGSREPTMIRLAPGEARRLEISVSPQRWGGYGVGPVGLTIRDRWQLYAYAGRAGNAEALRVYPRPELVVNGLAPRATRMQPGRHVSGVSGDGLEFTSVRPYRSGDRIRRLNRHMTARTGEPYVTEALLERSADVILLLDTFGSVRAGSDGTLEQTVRAADAIAAHHLARGDRVGVVAFGGVLRWLDPAGGARARIRIVETLIETEIVFSYVWKDVRIIPRRALPPHALVLVITALLDDRVITALLDLRARGIDVAAIVVPPFGFVRPATDAADRLWRLQHDTLRLTLTHAGVAVAEWPREAPLAQAMEVLTRWRRPA